MRRRFEQQLSLGMIPISATPVNKKCRHSLDKVILGLLGIFMNSEYSEAIFSLLESKLGKARLRNGRTGIAVLASVCTGSDPDGLR